MRDVIEMAREAGAVFPADGSYHKFEFEGSLERFAELVRADEREAYAHLAEKLTWADNKGVASAIRAQQALDKMAENARELGLDYEPVPENFMDALKFDVAMRDAMVANLVREGIGKHRARELADHFVSLATAQQQPVAYLCENAVGHKYFRWKKPSSTYKPIALYTSPQQPTVPDALTIADKDSADYHEGWNDCRALMLEMRKP